MGGRMVHPDLGSDAEQTSMSVAGDVALQQADALYQTGRTAEAEQAYDRLLQDQPDHPVALLRLAATYLSTARTTMAVGLLQRLIAVQPDMPHAHANMAAALMMLGQDAASLVYSDRAIALRPKFAEAYSNRGAALKKLRRYDEALAALDQAIALKADFTDAYGNRGGTLVEMGRHAEALASFDRAIVLNPRYAMAHDGRGIALDELGRPAEALASFDTALRWDPQTPDVHVRRGRLLVKLKRFEDAVASYDRALASQPDHSEAHFHRGVALSYLTRYEQALISYDRAATLAPGNADALSNRGVMLCQLGQFDASLASFDHALAIEPDRAEFQFNQSIVRLMVGDFRLGWPQYESRRHKAGHSHHHTFSRRPWTGQTSIAGRRLFAYWEQGLGDTIQFCRYAKLAKDAGAQVILYVQDPLVRLIRTLDPDIRVAGSADGTQVFDYDCPLMSLPLAFGTTPDTIPAAHRYLSADPALQGAWAARLGATARPLVGLAWRGSATHMNDHNRSIQPETLLPLLSPACGWVSLQKEVRRTDLAILRLGADITFAGGELDDFADTAALIATLDLVITVDTSIAHLAGALGKPVWILLPFIPDWRWQLGRTDTPWYPTARLFRQPALGDWDTVMAEVRDALASFPALCPAG